MFTDNCIGLQCKVQFKLKWLHPHPMSQTGEEGIRGKQKRRGFPSVPSISRRKGGQFPRYCFTSHLEKQPTGSAHTALTMDTTRLFQHGDRHSHSQDCAQQCRSFPPGTGGEQLQGALPGFVGVVPYAREAFPPPLACPSPTLCPRTEAAAPEPRLTPCPGSHGRAVLAHGCLWGLFSPGHCCHQNSHPQPGPSQRCICCAGCCGLSC